MKNFAFLKIFITAGFLSLLLFNAGSLRCESSPGEPDNLQPQVKRSDTAPGKTRDQNWLRDREAKHDRFKELEYLIKQNLLKQYEQMETAAYLEDNSD